MTGYNPLLSWLNRQDRGTLLGMFRQAHPNSSLVKSGAMSTDDLKAAVLAWAEGPDGWRFEAFRHAVDTAAGNSAAGEGQPCR